MPILASAAVVLALTAPTPTPPPIAQAPVPGLQDLAWMAGHWRSVEGQDVSDEVWMAPDGDAMLGMWRWLSGGRLRLYESLAIVRGEDGVPVMMLRHMRPDGSSREAADAPLRLRLRKAAAREVVFAGTGSDGAPLVITYRSPDGGTLDGIVEHGSERLEYRMRRTH